MLQPSLSLKNRRSTLKKQAFEVLKETSVPEDFDLKLKEAVILGNPQDSGKAPPVLVKF